MTAHVLSLHAPVPASDDLATMLDAWRSYLDTGSPVARDVAFDIADRNREQASRELQDRRMK